MADYLSVAQQIQILLDTVQHPSGRPYTMQEVSEAIDVSVATLSQLKTGKIKNPQLNTLREICRFFNVPLRYFETRTVDECYALLAAGQEPPPPAINEIAFRATQLSPEGQRDVLKIMGWVEAAEAKRRKDNSPSAPPNLENENED